MRSISEEEEDAEEREKYRNILEDKKDNPQQRRIPTQKTTVEGFPHWSWGISFLKQMEAIPLLWLGHSGPFAELTFPIFSSIYFHGIISTFYYLFSCCPNVRISEVLTAKLIFIYFLYVHTVYVCAVSTKKGALGVYTVCVFCATHLQQFQRTLNVYL